MNSWKIPSDNNSVIWQPNWGGESGNSTTDWKDLIITTTDGTSTISDSSTWSSMSSTSYPFGALEFVEQLIEGVQDLLQRTSQDNRIYSKDGAIKWMIRMFTLLRGMEDIDFLGF